VFVTTLAPVMAVILNYIPLNGKKLFYISEFGLLGVAFTLLLIFQDWRWGDFARYVWFLYFFEAAVFLYLFNDKFGFDKFNRSLAATMLIVYVLSEAHEYLGFMLSDYMKLYVDPFTAMAGFVPVWQRIMNNLYVIIAFIMGCKIAGVERSKINVMLFGISLLIPIPFLGCSSLAVLQTFKRIILFFAWFLIFTVRSKA